MFDDNPNKRRHSDEDEKGNDSSKKARRDDSRHQTGNTSSAEMKPSGTGTHIRFEDDNSDDGEEDVPPEAPGGTKNKPVPEYMVPLLHREEGEKVTFTHGRAAVNKHRPYLSLAESGKKKRSVPVWSMINMVDFKIVSIDDIFNKANQPYDLPWNPLDCSSHYLKGILNLMQAIRCARDSVTKEEVLYWQELTAKEKNFDNGHLAASDFREVEVRFRNQVALDKKAEADHQAAEEKRKANKEEQEKCEREWKARAEAASIGRRPQYKGERPKSCLW